MIMRLPGWYWRTWFRIHDKSRDLWDGIVHGTCLHVPDQNSGGYRHWRCGLERGHSGPHRYANYTWTGEGPVECDPVVDHDAPFVRPRRHGG